MSANTWKKIINSPKSLWTSIRSFFSQDFFHNAIVQWLSIGIIVFNLASWVILTIFIRPIDLPIIIHYNVYFGVDIIGSWWQVYFLPFIGGVFFIINFSLAHLFYEKKERIASYLFLLASLIIQLGIVIASTGIARVNY
jgi:hypothetical protein